MQEDGPSAGVPPGGLVRLDCPRPDSLREAPLADLVGELIGRLDDGDLASDIVAIRMGHKLRLQLEAGLDIRDNRLSLKRLHDCFGASYHSLGEHRPSLEGATILDIGCGSESPVAQALICLLAGAERGYAVDLGQPEDIAAATRHLVDAAQWMLTDPSRIVGELDISPARVLENLRGFDLAKLSRGDPSGIPEDRLRFLQESVYDLSIGDEAVDFMFSTAFLEHIADLDRAIAELARVARPGCIGAHCIDVSDHGRYAGQVSSPVAFLAEDPDAQLVRSSNRLRARDYLPIFERRGFDVLSYQVWERYDLDDDEMATFVEPFRSMPRDELEALIVGVAVRKR